MIWKSGAVIDIAKNFLINSPKIKVLAVKLYVASVVYFPTSCEHTVPWHRARFLTAELPASPQQMIITKKYSHFRHF